MIPREAWPEYLGKSDRVADWVSFFDREISELGWQQAVATWVPRLSPAIVSRAAHGLLRTAHAVRSLSLAETSNRLRELAEGLGYWASTWQTLPGVPQPLAPTMLPSDAAARVPRLHESGFVNQGLIWQSLQRLHDEPSFDDVINLVGPSDDVSGFLSDLTETAARWYLSDQTVPVVFVHTLTAPKLASLRRSLSRARGCGACGALRLAGLRRDVRMVCLGGSDGAATATQGRPEFGRLERSSDCRRWPALD